MSEESAEDRYSVPLSALEHHAYCPRQAVLIWQEAYFESNIDTVRGDIAHEAVDRGGVLTGKAGARMWRSLPVHHDRFGMHGVCDTVHWTGDGPVPVEHKSGTHKPGGPAELQVAAQVLCLREMFGLPVPHGRIFVGKTRRQYEVVVDARLETAVHDAVVEVRRNLVEGILPRAVHDRRCIRCSLEPGCLPETAGHRSTDLFTPRRFGDLDD